MSDKFKDYTNIELINRVRKLIDIHEEISPTLSDLLKRWSKNKRELQKVQEEIEKRGIKDA